MTIIAWVIFMVLIGFFFQDVLDKQYNPNQSVQTEYSQDGVREVRLTRNRQGHYVTTGAINGEPVVFMLDTGATGIAIPQGVAQRLGLRAGRPFQVKTANGTATAYMTGLESVSVGDIALRELPASISPGLGGEAILLGMSFLKEIEFTQRGDTLIMRQYP